MRGFLWKFQAASRPPFFLDHTNSLVLGAGDAFIRSGMKGRQERQERALEPKMFHHADETRGEKSHQDVIFDDRSRNHK